jgi:hypothetical protein
VTAAEQVEPTPAVPSPGQSWRLTATVTVDDFGPVPPGMVAFKLADGRPFLFPPRAGVWQRAEVPTAADVLEDRLHGGEREACNAARDSADQHRARAIADELTTIRNLISPGTTQ